MSKNLLNPIYGLIDFLTKRQAQKILQGYNVLKSRGDDTVIQDVRHAISIHKHKKFLNNSANYIFFNSASSADLVLRQYLVKRIGEIGLHKSILRAIGGGSKIHLLPPSLFYVLAEKKIPISYWSSFLYWYCYVFLIWLYSVRFIINSILKRSIKHKQERELGKYCYFIDLPRNALPEKENLFPRFDLVSWYTIWPQRNAVINSLRHNISSRGDCVVNDVPINYQEYPWPSIFTMTARLSILKWGVLAATRSFLDLLCGRWWHALLLHEAAKAKIVDVTPADKMATEYWFNHENYKYKPIWTYISESRGASSYLYFYSVNNQTVQPYWQKPSISGYWHLMNWKNCIVWGAQQEQILRQYTSNETNYIHVKEIPYTDDDTPLLLDSTFNVAVFDVPIRNEYQNVITGQSYNYYSYQNSREFFEQIVESSRVLGASIIIKNKSRGSKNLSKKYTHFLTELTSNFPNTHNVNSTISAHRVIKEVEAVISMPFTSTALIARAFGKPTCYYDPTGTLDKDTIYAYGIPVIQKPENLVSWLKNVISDT